MDVDPQYASLEKNMATGVQKYFLRRFDYRINFVNGFNIPLRPSIPPRYMTDCWERIDFPTSNTSAQILQPLFFASKNKLIFKDNIQIV